MSKELRLKLWSQVAEYCALDKDLDIEYIKPWQIRLTAQNGLINGLSKSIDLYPISQKVNIVGTLEYKVIEDIVEFLDKASPIPPEITL